MQEARELQRKLFTTFESVDDKSQEYSEAIEAVTEMSQPLLPYIGILVASIPVIVGSAKLIKKVVLEQRNQLQDFLLNIQNS